MAMLYCIYYLQYDEECDYKSATTRSEFIAINGEIESDEDAINIAIREFNARHNPSEHIYITSVHKNSISCIVAYLKDIVEEFSKGSLVFTDTDANAVNCAITLLEAMKEN